MLAKTVIALCLMFTLNCGINYHRQTFSERAGFELQESSVEELRALCEKLAEELNEAAGAIHVDAEGHMMLEENVEAEAAEAMQAAAEEYPELAGYYPEGPRRSLGLGFCLTSSCRVSTALLLWRPIIMETCRRRTYLLPSAMSFPI